MRASSRLFLHLLLFAGLLFAGPTFGFAAHATEPGSGELRWRDASGQLQALASLDTDVEYKVSGLFA